MKTQNPFEKILTADSEEKLIDGMRVVEEMKLLLDSNAAKEVNLLKAIGLSEEINFGEKKLADVITRAKHNKELEKKIVHKNEIADLCIKYRLYIKPANHYVGSIPKDLGLNLVNFCESKNIQVGNSSNFSQFFIMAPPKMFANYQSPAEILFGAVSTANDNRTERILRRKNDPILLYKIDNDYFAIVEAWGNDFAPLRRVLGFLTTPISVKILNFLISFCLVGYLLLFKFISWQWSKLYVECHKNGEVHGSTVLSVFIGSATIILFAFWLYFKWCCDFRETIINTITKEHGRLKRKLF